MLWKRGSLTPELADLVFTFLPLDLSVADEDDVLVYWKGATYKTCDARYIGRDVRDCHPEQHARAASRRSCASSRPAPGTWPRAGSRRARR